MSDLLATYAVQSADLSAAAQAIARGQSVGNPSITSPYESEQLRHDHAAEVLSIAAGEVTIRFPLANFAGEDGVTFLLSVLLGGQCDIDRIQSCRLVRLDVGSLAGSFPGPRHGVAGLRELLGVYGRPLLGSIIKPKIGLSPSRLADVCRQLAEGGLDVIKEDECLGNVPRCPLEARVEAASRALQGFSVLYLANVTTDREIVLRARLAHRAGATGVHCNLWAGFGALAMLRRDQTLPIHFQKSGDKVWTTGPFALAMPVLCQLVRMVGCDTMHVGMWGSYLNETPATLRLRLGALRDGNSPYKPVLPSFSCGLHPGLVQALLALFGEDILLLAGGAVHGHPLGITAGAKALRQALQGYERPPKELAAALRLWPVVTC